MVRSGEGGYSNGRVDLAEPLDEAEIARCGHLDSASIDLPRRGIGETQAADLRRSLAQFAEDWD